MDIQSKLFEVALGIKEPLYIKNIPLDEEIGELHIYVDFSAAANSPAPSAVRSYAMYTIRWTKCGVI